MPVGHNFLEQLRRVKVNKKSPARSIRDLIADFQSAKIVIPPYQRTFVWEIDKQCRFIESVFMDIPIPPLFFLEKFDEEQEMTIFEIIDGVQRLTTLCNFINGKLKLSNLNNLPDLNQSTFQTLPSNISSIFNERQLNTIVIESDTHPEIQFEVFGRLNMGSVSLNAQELRNCMFHGDFNDFLVDCSKNFVYRHLLDSFPRLKPPKEGKPDKNRMFDVELILRFFALYDFYNKETNQYPESRVDTLNEYMRQRVIKNEALSSKEQLEELLDKVVKMVKMTFSGNHFRNFSITVSKAKAGFASQVNAAVFDVQMLGFTNCTIDDIEGKTEVIYDAFLDLSSYNRDFIDALNRSTNSKVNERLGIWTHKLNLILENFEEYHEEFQEKKRLFESYPVCTLSGEKIENIEESDYFEGKLYHKCNSPKLTIGKNIKSPRASKNMGVEILLSEDIVEFDNLKELIEFLVERIVTEISDDQHDIERLQSCDFIGDQDQLLSTMLGVKKIVPFGTLKGHNGKRLYIKASGTRGEIIKNLNQLISLFSFTGNIKIID
jgi:hypothetical protein